MPKAVDTGSRKAEQGSAGGTEGGTVHSKAPQAGLSECALTEAASLRGASGAQWRPKGGGAQKAPISSVGLIKALLRPY